MEMPTPCLNIPATPPQPTVAAPTPQPSTTNAPTVSPPAIAANNTVQSPSNLTANSPPASFSSPSGNTTISRHPPAVSNATGKSSFDILGGG
jgi:hypothetical protein